MIDGAFAYAQDLHALTSAQAAMAVQPEDSDESMLRCAREHCAGCGIWNHLLTGHPVSMHYPRLRAFALSHKALLGLHAQAMAAGNAADTQVHNPAVSSMHVGQILGKLSPGFVIIMIDFQLLLLQCDAHVLLTAPHTVTYVSSIATFSIRLHLQ